MVETQGIAAQMEGTKKLAPESRHQEGGGGCHLCRLQGMVCLRWLLPMIIETALTERCVRDIGRSVRSGKVCDVPASRKGSGRRSKTSAVEEEIIAEMSKKDCHTLQEIADIIKEKFRIVLSLPNVSKLLRTCLVSRHKQV